jgi:hypothetical protein
MADQFISVHMRTLTSFLGQRRLRIDDGEGFTMMRQVLRILMLGTCLMVQNVPQAFADYGDARNSFDGLHPVPKTPS